jgi:hypothetical protein
MVCYRCGRRVDIDTVGWCRRCRKWLQQMALQSTARHVQANRR